MPSVKVDLSKAMRKLDVKSNATLGTFAASEAMKGMSPYVPFRNGYLDASAKAEPWVVTYNVRYAVYVYYGEKMTFSTERHALATANWADAYAAAHGQELASAIGRRMMQ